VAAKHRWGRYAAPTAFLAAATIAIVLVASALHHAQSTRTTDTATTTRGVTATHATAKTTTKHGRRYYTVVAGDTFGVIAGKTGVSLADLERLNPGVSSTSLHIGQKLRVS
jgi:LysM repeat protein